MAFDLERSWELHAKVALRPEPFGALAYHFGTRRLSFLKTRKLLTVVQRLGDHATGREACAAAGVTPEELPAYVRALDRLASSGRVVGRRVP
jgi:putative mycofactocin binding protein MftB